MAALAGKAAMNIYSKLRKVSVWRISCQDAANNSMDVRAKQRLCYLACLVSLNLRGGGFAPRHLKRWITSGL